MNEAKQKCWSCLRYKAFYVKGKQSYTQKKMGYCQQYKKVVGECDSCEKWLDGLASKRFRRFSISNQLLEIHSRLDIIEKALKDDVNFNEII